MKVKTAELAGPALGWAVAIAKGIPAEEIYVSSSGKYQNLYRRNRDEDGALDGTYTTGPDLLFWKKWEAGGPIIERERIAISYHPNPLQPGWKPWAASFAAHTYRDNTPLIAAMRCYVASKLGDEVDIPEELINE
jgi:hypothetical protein